MTPLFLSIISITCYLFSTALLTRDVIKTQSNKVSTAPAWVAVLTHFAYTLINFQQQTGFDFSFFNIASFISSLVALLLLLATLSNAVEKLGLAIYPIAITTLSLSLVFPQHSQEFKIISWQMSLHIFSSIIAFSLLNIAALQAIMLAIQERQLRKHPPSKLIQTLPSLQTMESLLFQMIATGVLLLTVSLTSGFIFIEDLFAQHLVHKTVLSIVAWFTFTGLLIGRIKYGWRGQTAVKWTLIGFLFLLLAYFGSKLVLEIILQKV
jgi:ABC-type uncharacterized transport system permease subunit